MAYPAASTYKIPVLKFPSASGDFWVLYWIGKLSYISGFFFTEFFFVNHHEDNLDSKFKPRSSNIKITLEASLMSTFKTGSIFDKWGRFRHSPNYLFTRKNYIKISLSYRNKSTSKKIRNLSSIEYPIPPKVDLEGFEYFEKKIFINGKLVRVILPVSAVCSFLFFNNLFITNQILGNSLDNLFETEAQDITDLKSNRSLIVRYDNRVALASEIHSISHFLFLQSGIGLKSINHISSSLRQRLMVSGTGNYLSMILPFVSKSNFELQGDFYNIGNSEIFLAYNVTNVEMLDNRDIMAKNVQLKPKYEGEDNQVKIIARRGCLKFQSEANKDTRRSNNSMVSWNTSLRFPIHTVVHNYYSKSKRNIVEDYYLGHEYLNVLQADLAKFNSLFAQHLAHNYELVKFKFIAIDRIDENFISTIDVGNTLFKTSVIELDIENKFFYRIEFSENFALVLSSELHFERISELRLRILMERIYFDFCYENFRFKRISFEDLSKYISLYNLIIYPYNPRGIEFSYNPYGCTFRCMEDMIEIIRGKLSA